MNHRIWLLWLSVILSVTILGSQVLPVQANQVDPNDMAPFLDEQVQALMEAEQIPNAAVAVVANGEVVYLRGFGSANRDENRPVDAGETLFRVGSVSKLFTWTAVMQLVEQGAIDLDADVNTYLDFEISARLIRSQGRTPPAPITMRHLLTHTPGFEAYPDEIFRLAPGQLLPLETYVRTHLPQRAFPPGEVAAYSNYGAALAGYIVQRVSGQPFAEYVEQNIFAPLEMDRSTFRQPVTDTLAANLAQPYRFINGDYVPAAFEYMQEPEGGSSSTAADMAKFMLAHLNGGTYNGAQILQEDTAQQMHSQQFTNHPQLGGMAGGFMEGSFNEQPTLFHGGSTMIYDSGLYLLPEQNVGIFMVYSGANHMVHTDLFQRFLDRYFPAPASVPPAPQEGAIERARQYAGEYQQNTRSFTTSESITSLFLGMIQVSAEDDGSLLVTHAGETDRFVETEPGVYQNLRQGRTQDYFGPFETIVFGTDPLNRTMLMPDGPMTYSRPPWYASSMFTIPALLLILLVMLISLVVWAIGFVVRLIRGSRSPRSGLATAAHLTGITLAFLSILFLLGVVATGSDDPLYNLPPAAFGVEPAWAPVHNFLPVLIILASVLAVVFALISWVKGFWRLPARIHYTLVTAAAVLLVWIFFYWSVV